MEVHCPYCGKPHSINIGRLLGSTKSEKKTAASKLNGFLGGRPKVAKPVRLRPYHPEHPKHREWLEEQKIKYAIPPDLKSRVGKAGSRPDSA